MRHKLKVAVGALWLAAACSNDPFSGLASEEDFGPERSGVGAESAGAVAIHGVVQLAGLLDADEIQGAAAVGVTGQLSAVALQIVSEAFFDDFELTPADERFAVVSPRWGWGASLASFPDCVDVGDETVRFRNCELTSGDTTTAIQGVIELVDGRVLADLDIDVSLEFDGTAQQASTHLRVDVAITDDRVDGWVDSKTSASVSGAGSGTQTTTLLFDIELEEGCPVGGELRAGAEQRARAGGQRHTMRAIGRVVFGPAWGDAIAYARLD